MSKRKTKINIGVALEGTISGGINRAKFAGKLGSLDNFRTLLGYLQHAIDCPLSNVRVVDVRHSKPLLYKITDGKRCTCGLTKFLHEAP